MVRTSKRSDCHRGAEPSAFRRHSLVRLLGAAPPQLRKDEFCFQPEENTCTWPDISVSLCLVTHAGAQHKAVPVHACDAHVSHRWLHLTGWESVLPVNPSSRFRHRALPRRLPGRAGFSKDADFARRPWRFHPLRHLLCGMVSTVTWALAAWRHCHGRVLPWLFLGRSWYRGLWDRRTPQRNKESDLLQTTDTRDASGAPTRPVAPNTYLSTYRGSAKEAAEGLAGALSRSQSGPLSQESVTDCASRGTSTILCATSSAREREYTNAGVQRSRFPKLSCHQTKCRSSWRR